MCIARILNDRQAFHLLWLFIPQSKLAESYALLFNFIVKSSNLCSKYSMLGYGRSDQWNNRVFCAAQSKKSVIRWEAIEAQSLWPTLCNESLHKNQDLKLSVTVLFLPHDA